MNNQVAIDAVVLELKALRERVMGITESVVSTGDGLLVAGDTVSVHGESLSALAAAALALGSRTAGEAGLGGLRDVVARCNGGHVVILAIGNHALLAIVGDEGLDIAGLHRESPASIARLDRILTGAA
ncbi:roadblock/LC7 domain-containing protein [Embleya sp. NPDC008237]|uniref:roadblock/LC7 domain-containing protein n=1 Tax=Embleya sp. NPDC008237 TaxID=3363978 RepID=UPI0036E4AC56